MPRAPISATRKRVSGVDAAHGERDADLAVERVDRGHRRSGAPSTWASRSLVEVLPGRPGDGDDGEVRRPVDDAARDPAERRLDVVDDDAGQLVDRPAGEGGHRPAVAGRARVRVPVGVLADAGDVEGAGAGLAGVGDDGAVDDESPGRLGVGMERPAGEHGEIPQGHRDHDDRFRSVDEAVQGCPESLPVVKSVHDAADLLAGLVALAEHEHGVVRRASGAPGQLDRLGDRLAAPGARAGRGRVCCGPRGRGGRRAGADAGAGEDLGADAGGVLGARVVVGDDDVVGPRPGRRPHGPPLPAVAVAAGAEDDDEAARASTAAGRAGRPRRRRGYARSRRRSAGRGGGRDAVPVTTSIRPGTDRLVPQRPGDAGRGSGPSSSRQTAASAVLTMLKSPGRWHWSSSTTGRSGRG